ncbi:unnamed protein product [Absidia cylindrospora]
MPSHPTLVMNLDSPNDLLLSYLNADYLDTTIATDVVYRSPSSISSSNYHSDLFSPIYSSHPTSLSSSSFPFSLAMNSSATNLVDTFDLLTGVSPCHIPRASDSPSSTLNHPTSVAPPLVSCTKSSTPSPTLSISTTSSSSYLDEPRRKRKRRNQNGSKRHCPSTRQSLATIKSTMYTCKPILPASFATDDQRCMDHHPFSLTPTTIIKHKPVDTSNTSVLASLDNSHCPNDFGANQEQPSNEKRPPQSPLDANSKRQERLIKNRAAALLSRKRKREHLQALEDERQWLIKDNGALKSKTAALEAKLKQLEKEHNHQAQQLLLLQQQQQQTSLLSCEPETSDGVCLTFPASSPSLDSRPTVTNVLVILLLSFALLSLPGTSDTRLFINEDNQGQSFTGSSSQNNTNNFMHGMSFTLFPKHRQEQLFSTSDSDTSNKPQTMERRHRTYYHDLHALEKMGR